MGERNASASAFGWDFQANAAIFLMLENIKQAKNIRVEGADEDIEITLLNNEKIYSQVKAVAKPEDSSNVIAKLSAALETLNLDARNGDAAKFTYTTNSPNPFNDKSTMGYFTGLTHLDFDELPQVAKDKIIKIIREKGYSNVAIDKFDIRVIPFYGRDPKNKFKSIQNRVEEFLDELQIPYTGVAHNILNIWQRDFFQNATMPETDISISKAEMMWPLIVLVLDKSVANDYKKDFDDDEILEIERRYGLVINQKIMLYEFVTKVQSAFRLANVKPKEFVSNKWSSFLYILDEIDADDTTKETIIKIILFRILSQRQYIEKIKKGVNL